MKPLVDYFDKNSEYFNAIIGIPEKRAHELDEIGFHMYQHYQNGDINKADCIIEACKQCRTPAEVMYQTFVLASVIQNDIDKEEQEGNDLVRKLQKVLRQQGIKVPKFEKGAREDEFKNKRKPYESGLAFEERMQRERRNQEDIPEEVRDIARRLGLDENHIVKIKVGSKRRDDDNS